MQKSFADCHYVFRDWMDASKMPIEELAGNSHAGAIRMVKEVINEANKQIALFIKRPVETFDKWATTACRIEYNKVEAMKAHRRHIGRALSSNPHPNALKLLCENPNIIDWPAFTRNTHPTAAKMLLENPNKIDRMTALTLSHPDVLKYAINHFWYGGHYNGECYNILFANPSAIELNFINGDSYWWHTFSIKNFNMNPHPKAIKMLSERPEDIHWEYLCKNTNPDALALFEKYKDYDTTHQHLYWDLLCKHIDLSHPLFVEYMTKTGPENFEDYIWHTLAKNPHIFIDEYDRIARAYFRDHIAAELCARVWHPRNMDRFKDWGVDMDA